MTPAVSSVAAGMEDIYSLSILQLPRGLKPAPVDNRILHMKQKYRAVKHHHEHGAVPLYINSLIKAGVYMAILFFINIFANSSNANSMSSFTFMTGEPANIDYFARHVPGSIVLVPAEPTIKNNSEFDKKIYAVALHPEKSELNTKK